MRRMMLAFGALAVLAASLGSTPVGAASQAAADLSGRWKLVVQAFGDDEFAIFDVKKEGEALTGTPVANQTFFANPKIESIKLEGEAIEVNFVVGRGKSPFRGTIADEKTAYGTFVFGGSTYPAKIERTSVEKVGSSLERPLVQKVEQAKRQADAKVRVEQLLAVIEKHANDGAVYRAYEEVLKAAEPAGYDLKQVEGVIGRLDEATKRYGPAWQAEVRSKVLAALAGKKPYAPLAVEIAKTAEAGLAADASAEIKAKVVEALASAATLAGDEALAKEARARADALIEVVDAEYRKNVPPFKPEPLKRADDAKKVVVMEIFTGSECPPCVAADVAFDALMQVAVPTEVIGLQYHLHIPRPDPLTNEGAIERSKFYEVRGTPSTFFNGQDKAGGGGGMDNAQGKFDQFLSAIGEMGKGEPGGTIDLQAKRAGEEITIQVAATVTKPKEKAAYKLRLVLIEEEVRFPGGNKLLYHHHVVRDLPGGAAGIDLAADGTLAAREVKVDLAKLRQTTEEYLTNYQASGNSFAAALPKLAFEKLAVVALIQEEESKQILHAAQVEVGASNP